VKLLIVGVAAFGGLCLVALPLLVFAVIATHPWLAVGAFSTPIQVVAPTANHAPAHTSAPGPENLAAPPEIGPLLGDVLDVARTWLGVPYAFGGCSRRGVDCSCFVQLVYRALGVNLPRVASDQFNATARLSREDLVPGDLVFFANTYMPGISHVGIYIGGGQQINAPTEGQTVSIQPVFSGYWGAHYAGAGRVK
jgi:cell wall-associated NlpC family hydrolase